MKLVLNYSECTNITREWLINIINTASKIGKIGVIRVDPYIALEIQKFKRSELEGDDPNAKWSDPFTLCGFTFIINEDVDFEIVFL